MSPLALAIVLACPACAKESGSLQLALLLAAMIAVPYAVVMVALYAIRGGGR